MHVGRGARQPVAAALHAHAHRAAASAPELRVVGVGVDAHFLDGVGGRHEAEVAAAALAVGVRRAVEQEAVAAADPAVDVETVHAAVVERPVADARARRVAEHAWRREDEHERVLPVQRRVGDLVRVDDGRPARARRVQQRRLGDDLDLVGQPAQLESDVHAKPFTGAHLDLARDRLEARHRVGHFVGAGHEAGDQIHAGVGGHAVRVTFVLAVERRNGHAGEHCALWVGKGARQRRLFADLGASWDRDGQRGNRCRRDEPVSQVSRTSPSGLPTG